MSDCLTRNFKITNNTHIVNVSNISQCKICENGTK